MRTPTPSHTHTHTHTHTHSHTHTLSLSPSLFLSLAALHPRAHHLCTHLNGVDAKVKRGDIQSCEIGVVSIRPGVNRKLLPKRCEHDDVEEDSVLVVPQVVQLVLDEKVLSEQLRGCGARVGTRARVHDLLAHHVVLVLQHFLGQVNFVWVNLQRAEKEREKVCVPVSVSVSVCLCPPPTTTCSTAPCGAFMRECATDHNGGSVLAGLTFTQSALWARVVVTQLIQHKGHLAVVVGRAKEL